MYCGGGCCCACGIADSDEVIVRLAGTLDGFRLLEALPIPGLGEVLIGVGGCDKCPFVFRLELPPLDMAKPDE